MSTRWARIPTSCCCRVPERHEAAFGADYRNEYVARFSVRDGRISRFAEYMNPIILFKAMGGQIGSVASVANPSLLPQLLNTAGG